MLSYFVKLVPGAVETAMSEDVEFRRGLPIGYLDHNGIAFSDNKVDVLSIKRIKLLRLNPYIFSAD